LRQSMVSRGFPWIRETRTLTDSCKTFLVD
jgi:hypothetical protein